MASNLIPSVSDRTFESEVLKSQVPVLLDFTATWCGPCRVLKPILEKVAQSYGGKIRVMQLDIDESPETPSQFGIRSVPTVILFKNGQEVARQLGAVPEAKIVSLITPHVAG